MPARLELWFNTESEKRQENREGPINHCLWDAVVCCPSKNGSKDMYTFEVALETCEKICVQSKVLKLQLYPCEFEDWLKARH
jgi:hypothetical protein